MGADLIGHFVIVPDEACGRVVETALDTITSILGDKKASLKKKIHQLEGVGVYCQDLADNRGLDLDGDGDRQDVLDQVQDLADDARGFSHESGARDLSSICRHVNGKAVTIMFAGELSYGDEPDGGGYTVLKALQYLGIADAFEREINWGARPPEPVDPTSGPSEDPQG